VSGPQNHFPRTVMPVRSSGHLALCPGAVADILHSKRLVVKDSAVNAVCYGAKLMLPGLLRYGKCPRIPTLRTMTNMAQKAASVRFPTEFMSLAASWSCLIRKRRTKGG